MRPLPIAFAVIFAASALPADARSTLAENLKAAHAGKCATEDPCNYCTAVSGDWKDLAVEPSDLPWGSECRFKSSTGWQKGIVYTVYPDKPFSVNFKK
jgi:hypothetical protein